MAILDRNGFADTLTGDIAKLETALEGEPWLRKDLQVIIDPKGHVHVIDLSAPCGGASCTNSNSTSAKRKVASIASSLRSFASAVSESEKVDKHQCIGANFMKDF